MMAGSLASLLAGDVGDGLASRAPVLQTHSPRVLRLRRSQGSAEENGPCVAALRPRRRWEL